MLGDLLKLGITCNKILQQNGNQILNVFFKKIILTARNSVVQVESTETSSQYNSNYGRETVWNYSYLQMFVWLLV